jgi:UDP-N-acetylmuramyl pentapeptide phosphotransferase/UDP-N-acetylglucosamine-1-phosphate transferase
MTPDFIAAVALACGIAAWLVLALLRGSGLAERIALDRANARSLHAGVVPRVGGLAVIGVTAAAGFVTPTGLSLVAGLAGALMLLGWLDDRYGLPVGVRLVAHLLAALAAAELLMPAAPMWQWLLLALMLTWAMNLYNFMDGADGLAGGMAVFGFGAYSLAGIAGDAHGLALLSASVAGAAAGFLPHNWAPARVFLGDAGSVPLGFLAGVLGVAGWTAGVWPAWFPLLVFSPFVVDASVTLLRRLLRGERIWQPHREHLYQRMVRSGLGHGRTALAWYAAMGLAAGSALAALNWPKSVQFGLLLAWFALYATVIARTWRLATRLDE